MSERGRLRVWALGLVLAVCVIASGTAGGAIVPVFEDDVVAGGRGRFMEVRHVVIAGSNVDIGRRLGALAKKDGIRLKPSGETVLNRLRREYLAKNYPAYFDRMRGVADAYGLRLEDDRYDFSMLAQTSFAGPGCSVVFYPGSTTMDGHGYLSRNFDFRTGTTSGQIPRSGQSATVSRPIILELHPDKGYASIANSAFDLLGGVLDGINSEGLAVSIMAEEESIPKVGLEGTRAVGLHELLSMRYLLDNCKNVDEARDALLSLKQYYLFVPCHYIVADASGRSFVFEFSPGRNRELITLGEGPQCVTNHLLAIHPAVEGLPAGDSFDRWKVLWKATHGRSRFTVSDIRTINESVARRPPDDDAPGLAPVRTLWYALYDTTERSLSVRFYLGEKPGLAGTGSDGLEYSQALRFRLK